MLPSEINKVYDEFKTNIFPYTKGNIHPRFFAWVQGTGTPMGVLAELLSAAMNPNVTNPFCIVANVGTVNTAAIDPLDELQKISKRYNLWFHIDGAFGALAKLVLTYASKLKAIEEADSVAFDLHKWMYMPYEIACVLIKDSTAHRASFATNPDYLIQETRGLAAGPDLMNNYGLELSRGFKSLKVWMSIKEHGLERYVQMIQKNIDQAFYLEELINNSNDLELLSKVSLNIVCYRFIKDGLSSAKLNELNKEIILQLQEQGIASPSSTILNDHFVIRVCIVNQRTKQSDIDLLIAETLRIGNSLVNLNFLYKETV